MTWLSLSRITPSQMSARSYRKPRNSKTRSNMVAEAQDWKSSHCDRSTPLFWGHKGACEKTSLKGSCSPGQLQVFPAWLPWSRVLLEHTVLCSFPVLSPATLPAPQPWDPPPRLLSRARAPELASWGLGHLGPSSLTGSCHASAQ